MAKHWCQPLQWYSCYKIQRWEIPFANPSSANTSLDIYAEKGTKLQQVPLKMPRMEISKLVAVRVWDNNKTSAMQNCHHGSSQWTLKWVELKLDFQHYMIHPGRLTWNLQITNLERNMIFQASIIMVHVKSSGVYLYIPSPPPPPEHASPFRVVSLDLFLFFSHLTRRKAICHCLPFSHALMVAL